MTEEITVDSRKLEKEDSTVEAVETISPFLGALREMVKMPQIECPVVHHFVSGFYIREFHAPKGAYLISKLHKTIHQFSITKGIVSVLDQHDQWITYGAPCHGITIPGTQRALIVHEDLVWTTTHAVFTQDLEEIEDLLFERQEIPGMSPEEKDRFDRVHAFHWQNPDKPVLLEEFMAKELEDTKT